MFSFQRSHQQPITTCHRHGNYTLLAASMIMITGCGGGGSSSVSDTPNPSDNTATTVVTVVTPTPTPTVVTNTDTTPLNPHYKGKRELATITEAAALDFISFGEIADIGMDLTKPVQTLDIGLLDVNLVLLFKGNGSTDCYNGGNASIQSTNAYLDADKLVSVNDTLYSYNNCISDTGSKANGRYTQQLSAANLSTIIRRETAVYKDFTITNKNVTGIFDGTSSIQVSGVKLSTESNLYTNRKNTEVLKVGFQQIGAGSFDGTRNSLLVTQGSITEMHGRVYLGNYGYVEPKVVQAMSFTTENVFSGELILTGANNTKAQMFPASTTSFVLNTDENGDGAYEKTRIVPWSGSVLSFLW